MQVIHAGHNHEFHWQDYLEHSCRDACLVQGHDMEIEHDAVLSPISEIIVNNESDGQL